MNHSVNTSQVLGAPLYLVNKDWYNAWVAFTKQSFNLLTVSLTQWWAPTVVRASGDESVRGQLLQTVDGNLLCNFPQRLVLIANHQVCHPKKKKKKPVLRLIVPDLYRLAISMVDSLHWRHARTHLHHP